MAKDKKVNISVSYSQPTLEILDRNDDACQRKKILLLFFEATGETKKACNIDTWAQCNNPFCGCNLKIITKIECLPMASLSTLV